MVLSEAVMTAADQDEEVSSITISTNRGMAPSMSEFYNNELLSDIDICSEEGQRFHCHKLVLINWSAPLRRMLTGDMLEGRERTITIHGCCGEVLGALLRFMYSCECSLPPGKLVALTALADQYDVLLLTELCREAIRGHLHNQRCCCLFYKAAKEVQQADIQQMAWESLSSNLGSLVRQHAVFVQLELEDVLLLCGKPAPAAAAAARPGSSSGSNRASQAGSSRAAGLGDVLFPLRLGPPERSATAAAAASGQAAHRPEYLLFVALMAWLDHKPERQQHKQQLLDCINFDRMNNYELAQMRNHPHVQSDDQLKELLLDAYARRCLQQCQQPLYHMQPLGERWPHAAGAAALPLAAGAGAALQQQDAGDAAAAAVGARGVQRAVLNAVEHRDDGGQRAVLNLVERRDGGAAVAAAPLPGNVAARQD